MRHRIVIAFLGLFLSFSCKERARNSGLTEFSAQPLPASIAPIPSLAEAIAKSEFNASSKNLFVIDDFVDEKPLQKRLLFLLAFSLSKRTDNLKIYKVERSSRSKVALNVLSFFPKTLTPPYYAFTSGNLNEPTASASGFYFGPEVVDTVNQFLDAGAASTKSKPRKIGLAHEVVFISNQGCDPCQELMPTYEGLVSKGYNIRTIEDYSEEAIALMVAHVPTFVLYDHQRHLVGVAVGKRTADEIASWFL